MARHADAWRASRLIAGNNLHRQTTAGGFPVLGVHVFAGFVHGLDHFIETHALR